MDKVCEQEVEEDNLGTDDSREYEIRLDNPLLLWQPLIIDFPCPRAIHIWSGNR